MINRQEDILSKIKTVIQELAQQNETMLRDPNKVNEVELKLFYAKSQFLANLIEILEQVQPTSLASLQKGAISHIPVYEVNQPKPQKLFQKEEVKKDKIDTPIKKVQTITPQRPQSTFVVGAPKTGLKVPVSKEKETTFVERQQIHDLASGISLNDKWLFIKDLFGGATSTYNEAIELTNKCQSFEEANRFLQRNYATVNDWSNKESAFNKFYAILGRRFPR